MKAIALFVVITLGSLAFGQMSAPAPSECKVQDILANGMPIMTPIRKHLALGISLSQRRFDALDKIVLHVWVINTGRNPIGVMTCEDLGFFKERVRLFDHDGRRIRRKSDIETCSSAREKGYSVINIPTCNRNFAINIPPHTCVTRDDQDFSTELTAEYDLPPDEYILRYQVRREPDDTDMCTPQDREPIHVYPSDLTFRVIKP